MQPLNAPHRTRAGGRGETTSRERRRAAHTYTAQMSQAAERPAPQHKMPTAARSNPRPSGEARARSTYAVVDVETTGLDRRLHRVVECAVVVMDDACDVLREWSSLVAIPGVDEIGAGFVHGITRAMLTGAPTFAELLPELVHQLRGNVVVGHVITFDLGHLAAEFERAGLTLPDVKTASLCTRDLARAYLPPGPRSLAACCTAAGVPLTGAHTALGDARAAAGLLRAFVDAGHAADWEQCRSRAASVDWPGAIPPGRTGVSRTAPRPPIYGGQPVRP